MNRRCRRALTAKQQRFVDEYLIDLNATQAAIRAGYSPRTANEQASQLLAKLSVAAAVARRQAELSRRTGINAERVLQELALIAHADISEVIGTATTADEKGPRRRYLVLKQDLSELPPEVRRVISEISETKDGLIKVRLYDKLAALQQIGRYLGMFVDRTEHTGEGGGPIKHEHQVIQPANVVDERLRELGLLPRVDA